jgi:hypothetical protein
LRAGLRIKFDSRAAPFIFKRPMADIPPPNPPPVSSGAVQPPKKETGKVQPKKETVRINLPPKPTSAPTIKLPTLPPGGPTGAPSPVSAPGAPAHALRTAAAPAAAPARGQSPATAQQRPATMQRSAAASAAPAIRTLDKVLILTAAVASLVAVGAVGYVFWILKSTVENFSS